MAEKLGSLGDSRAIEALVSLLDTIGDSDSGGWDIRYATCESLGKLRAVDALIKALNHRSTTVAYNAAINLGKIGDKKAIDPLKSAVKTHTDNEVRDAAKKALYQLGASSEMSQMQLNEALLKAASEGDFGKVNILLDKGANPNAIGLFNSTPLSNALANGHTTVAQILRDRMGIKGVKILVESNLANMFSGGIITPPETMVSSIDQELADANYIQHGDFIDYIQKNGFVSPVTSGCLSEDERLKLIQSQFPNDRWACCIRITEGTMTRYNVVVAFWI